MPNVYSSKDAALASNAVSFSVSHPLFSIVICKLSFNRESAYREYQEWLRTRPYDVIGSCLYRLRGHDIITTSTAFDQAQVLIGLSRLSEGMLRRWYTDTADYRIYPDAEIEETIESLATFQSDPLYIARSRLIEFLDNHRVQYTTVSMEKLFDELCEHIGNASQPKAS